MARCSLEEWAHGVVDGRLGAGNLEDELMQSSKLPAILKKVFGKLNNPSGASKAHYFEQQKMKEEQMAMKEKMELLEKQNQLAARAEHHAALERLPPPVSPRASPSSSTVPSLTNFLAELDLQEFESSLVAEGIKTVKALGYLEEDDLKKIGLPTGVALAIMRSLQELNSR